MRVRIDIGSVHGYLDGKFIPDADNTVVWNDNTTYKELEQAILKGAKA